MNKLTTLAFLAALLLCPNLLQAYDWNNLSDKDIAEIREARHRFYEEHVRGHGEDIAEHAARGMTLDGNQADFDMRYYGLHLDLNFTNSTIDASIDYRVKSLVTGLPRVDLNLRDELIVDSAKVEGLTASFTHSSHLLSVTIPTSIALNQEFAMTVYYHGAPYYDGNAGLTFTNEFGTDLCWTKATPFRSRHWWPCKDFPEDKVDSLDIYIECPSSYDIATVGLKVSSSDLGGGRKLEHFKHNYTICTYLVAFCCATYTKSQSTWNYGSYSMPYLCYSLPGNSAAMTAFQSYGPQSLTILSDRYGLYPFVNEKMGCADFGWSGAMEHQTFAMFSTDFHTDWVIAHESAHQWWGDMITCRTFNHIWINEGFATYSEALYREAVSGTTAYHSYMQTLKFLGAGSIYVENLTPTDIYNSNLSYDKAAWVLHMLRGVYGDSLFFQGVRAFGNSPLRFGTATTEDFISIFSASIGEDVSWFINEWIYGEANPAYEFSWQCRPDGLGDYTVDLFIEQKQTTPTVFKMPVRLRLTTTAGIKDTTVWNDGRFGIYALPVADSVTGIAFDPQQWILRTVTQVPFGVHVITSELPDAVLGESYSETLEAVGGLAPYTWQFLGGDLPFGMDFDAPSATVSGVPSYAADYFFTIACTDSDTPAKADTISLSIAVVEPQGICGDADGSGLVTISDVVFLINYIFSGGPAPDPLSAADPDCNGLVTISDAVYLINFIFAGGAAPCAACP